MMYGYLEWNLNGIWGHSFVLGRRCGKGWIMALHCRKTFKPKKSGTPHWRVGMRDELTDRDFEEYELEADDEEDETMSESLPCGCSEAGPCEKHGSQEQASQPAEAQNKLRKLVEKWRDEADDWLEDETTLWPFELRKALADRFLRHADDIEQLLSHNSGGAKP
jgi:hypothetical protein